MHGDTIVLEGNAVTNSAQKILAFFKKESEEIVYRMDDNLFLDLAQISELQDFLKKFRLKNIEFSSDYKILVEVVPREEGVL